MKMCANCGKPPAGVAYAYNPNSETEGGVLLCGKSCLTKWLQKSGYVKLVLQPSGRQVNDSKKD